MNMTINQSCGGYTADIYDDQTHLTTLEARTFAALESKIVAFACAYTKQPTMQEKYDEVLDENIRLRQRLTDVANLSLKAI
jgi:hypothetical protein